jgi:formate hydrogenlyase transcriptional activator
VSPGPVLQAPVRELKGIAPPSANVQTLAAAESEAILKALRETSGRVGGPQGAAAKLGMKRTTLQAKMRKLGIESNSH